MAHEFTSGAFALTPAWHGLGVTLNNVPDSEAMIAAADLDWTVSKRRLTAEGGIDCGDNRAVVRDDTNTVLGIVGDGYGIVQNREAFSFLDNLIQDGVMKYESAMALRGGAVIAICARLPSVDQIAANDNSHRYILFQTSHDGSMRLHALPTAVRVVCMNTLRLALSNAALDQNLEAATGGASKGIRHTSGIKYRLRNVQTYLAQLDKQFTLYRDNARRLAEARVSRDTDSTGKTSAMKYIDALFPPTSAREGRAFTIRENKVSAVRRNFRNERNSFTEIKDTWWGLYNSVTELIDHDDTTTYRGDNDRARAENRYLSLTSGTNADFKNRAFTLALNYAGVTA
jgi:phage/plasmid-like protein (TIGR03299 family)